MEDKAVYVVISEKNGYKNFEGVFAKEENADRYIATAKKSWNRGTDSGFSYFILPTWID